jgi:hypothetical protein
LLKNRLSPLRGVRGTRPLGTNGNNLPSVFPGWEDYAEFRSAEMRKTIMTLVAALAVAFTLSSPADAGSRHKHPHKATIITGAVVGTLVGFGLYEGWFGTSSSLTTGTLASSTAGAATGGFIAGVATVALIHASTTPCSGFHAIFQGAGCKNGKYIGKHRHTFLWW